MRFLLQTEQGLSTQHVPLGFVLTPFPDLMAKDSPPSLISTNNSAHLKSLMCRKCGALPFQLDKVENIETKNQSWLSFKANKKDLESSTLTGIKYQCGVCRNTVTIESFNEGKKDLFQALNTELGTHDIKITNSPFSNKANSNFDEIGSDKRIVALVFDVSEPNDKSEISERSEKFFKFLGEALDSLKSKINSQDGFGEIQLILFVSFRRNLFVLSEDRMIDLTEFTMFHPDESAQFCPGYGQDSAKKGNVFKLLSGGKSSSKLQNHELTDPPSVDSLVFHLSSANKQLINKLAGNFKELVQWKLSGNSIKNWGDSLTGNSKLNQIFTVSKILTQYSGERQIIFFNSTYSLSFDYGTGDHGILEKDQTIAEIGDFMKRNRVWIDSLVLERSHMVDILKLMEHVGGKVEFLAGFWSKNNPNTLIKFTHTLGKYLFDLVFTNVQLRVIVPEQVNYLKFHTLFDSEIFKNNDLSRSIFRKNESTSAHFSIDYW